MKGTIFGRRKWVGFWGAVASLIIYSVIANVTGIPEDIATAVTWGIVSVYGVYVTGNAASKFTGRGNRPEA